MLLTIILFIVGLIASYFIARWQMKKNKIVHFTIKTYDIGKGLRDDFPEFELHFSGETLSKEVKVIKGGFINIGKNDIENTEFNLVLPDGCIVKTIKITPTEGDLVVNASTALDKKNTINFVINGIFISDEYFEYTAIVEVPEGIEDIADKMLFQHRIKNTEKIKKIYLGEYEHNSSMRKNKRRTILIGSAIIIPFYVILCMYPMMRFKVFQNETNKEVKVYIDPQSNLIVCKPHSLLIPFGKKITVDEFENNYNIISYKSFSLFNEFSIMTFLLIIMIILYLIAENTGKDKHIIRVLKKTKQKSKEQPCPTSTAKTN